MTHIYYSLVLINAGICLAVAWAVFWKNRYQAVGPLFGITMVLLTIWMVGFAQYFQPMPAAAAVSWAKVTLSASILTHCFLFHSMTALAGRMRQFRWWSVAFYGAGAMFLAALWTGNLVVGLERPPYMDHYIRYNRLLYPLLGVYILGAEWFGVGVMAYSAKESVGYKRTQLIYFTVAIVIVFLTTTSIILPVEYGLYVQPFGFFILPVNLALLAYVLARARLADFNVVIARVLLHAVTLIVVVGASLLFIGAMALLAPGFMNPNQVLFTISLVVVIGLALAMGLPRLLPRAERLMQERLFGTRYGYQDALAGLVKELSRISNLDALLGTVATTVHSQMQVSRVLILMQDPLSGQYAMQAQSGLTAEEAAGMQDMNEHSPVVRWLRQHKDQLVREEAARRLPEHAVRELAVDLDRLKVSLSVPMILDDRLVGMICLGPKVSGEMFFVSDLRLLETLATEVALAVKYRRMEEEVFRKNKLAELGTIAAGVAHEIRNPLASIRTFAQLMPERMDDPEFKNEFSKLVLKDVDRITKVVESMLAFARPAQVTIAEHSSVDLVEEAVLLVRARLRNKSIELTKQFHDKPVLRADKQQILQVLVNLLSNAVDALPEQGKIRIATGTRWMDGAGAGSKPRQYAVIEVADNGPGIPAAVRNRLFDPFFTTKKEGTGLGLSISQKIVRDHGGIITVSSIEGKGTTFQVNLPLN
jgi:signal transduction histidine kinase